MMSSVCSFLSTSNKSKTESWRSKIDFYLVFTFLEKSRKWKINVRGSSSNNKNNKSGNQWKVQKKKKKSEFCHKFLDFFPSQIFFPLLVTVEIILKCMVRTTNFIFIFSLKLKLDFICCKCYFANSNVSFSILAGTGGFFPSATL